MRAPSTIIRLAILARKGIQVRFVMQRESLVLARMVTYWGVFEFIHLDGPSSLVRLPTPPVRTIS